MNQNTQKPRLIPLAELHEDPANVRKHGERNRASVRASLREFGQVETLVVQRGTGRVLGGNCRLQELRALGVDAAWCVEVEAQGVDATRLALALNRTAELAEWDAEGLAAMLVEFDAEELSSLWSADEIAALLPESEDEPNTAAQLGDLEYRVLVKCADEAQQSELIARLEEEGWTCQPLIS